MVVGIFQVVSVSAYMSASFLEAANLRTRHSTSQVLRAAWRREPTRMQDAARRYLANFDQHRPDHFNNFWRINRRVYNRIQDPQLANTYTLNTLIGIYGSSGFFDFAIYPVRGIIVHALNRIKRWIFRAQLTVLVRARQRRERIRQGNYDVDLVREANPTSRSAAGAA